jgi:hypothetical protein
MTKQEFNTFHNLLSHLRDFDVLRLVKEHYGIGYNNSAPAELLDRDIEESWTIMYRHYNSIGKEN